LGLLLHDGRLAIDHLWLGKAADVDPAIKAGLADADGNLDVARKGRSNGGSRCGCEGETLHAGSPVVSGLA